MEQAKPLPDNLVLCDLYSVLEPYVEFPEMEKIKQIQNELKQSGSSWWSRLIQSKPDSRPVFRVTDTDITSFLINELSRENFGAVVGFDLADIRVYVNRVKNGRLAELKSKRDELNKALASFRSLDVAEPYQRIIVTQTRAKENQLERYEAETADLEERLAGVEDCIEEARAVADQLCEKTLPDYEHEIRNTEKLKAAIESVPGQDNASAVTEVEAGLVQARAKVRSEIISLRAALNYARSYAWKIGEENRQLLKGEELLPDSPDAYHSATTSQEQE